MSRLHPTPTRLAVLRAIANGYARWSERRGFTVGDNAINAKLDELERAGWVEIANWDNRQTVAITEAGRTVLAAADATKP